MLMNKVFKSFFNCYDTLGVLHTGFVQSLDLSAYTDLTMLNDLSSLIIDNYLYNELKNRVVLSRWKEYLVWDETTKRFIIKPDFYNEAVVAIYVYLAKQQKFFDILETDFRSLSAQESETVNFGSKLTSKVNGEKLKTNVFDNVVVELSKGTETENRGTHTDTENLGTHTDSETKGQYTDTENIGQQTNGSTKTDKIFPFDAVAFVNDTQSEETSTNGAQINSTQYGAQSNSTIFGAQSNSNVYGAQENTRSFGKTTNETKTHTDTERHSAYTDNETVSAHIDSKTKTKVLILSPEKYFEIQKELAEKNIYTLFSQAVNECFLNDNFEFCECDKWGCIV